MRIGTGRHGTGMGGGDAWAGMGGGGAMDAPMAMVQSPGEPSGLGLRPERHIAGFSIRKEDGTPIPLIFEAAVGKARDTVVLKLAGPVPEKASLWYGHGLDPYCNLTDGADMAVPVFGPIALDEVPDLKAPAVATALAATAAPSRCPSSFPASRSKPGAPAPAQPFLGGGQALDHHRRSWSRLEGDDPVAERDPLAGREDRGRCHDHAGEGPDRRQPREVRRAPAQLQGHARRRARDEVVRRQQAGLSEGGPATARDWSSSISPRAPSPVRTGTNSKRRSPAAGGSQGFHGPKHVYTVKKTEAKHPISEGFPPSSSTRSTSCTRTR